MNEKRGLMFFFFVCFLPSVSTQTFVADLLSGVELSFKTRSPDGLLLSAFSPGNQEEFLALQIKDGSPYFLFDPQVCKVVFNTMKERGRVRNNKNNEVLLFTPFLEGLLSVSI